MLLMLGVFCLAFVGALCYYSLGYYAHTEEQGVIASLQEENALLEKVLSSNKKDIADMVVVMDGLAEDDQRLRNLNQMEISTDEYRAGGIGGGEDLPDDYTQLPTSKRLLIQDISARLSRLQLDAGLQVRSFAALHASFLRNEKDLSITPSITPVPSTGGTWKSSDFGNRVDPFTGKKQRHTGIDFAGRKGTDIYATADGVVVYSHDGTSGLGNVVVIQHEKRHVNEDGETLITPAKYRTEYGHLEKRLVEKGDLVKRWDVIGKMGSTGRSTGPHLHYAVRLQSQLRKKDKGYIDPRDYLTDWDTDDPVAAWQNTRAE